MSNKKKNKWLPVASASMLSLTAFTYTDVVPAMFDILLILVGTLFAFIAIMTTIENLQIRK